MNKLLLASALMISTAPMALAEVSLSGDARMGILADLVAPGSIDVTPELAFTSRARVKVDMSGDTDGGMSFGASFRVRDAVDATSGLAGEVFLSGPFGKISMGDVDGAAVAAIGHVSYVGLTDLQSLNEVRYISNGFSNDLTATDPSVLFEYTTGDLTFYASVVNPQQVTEEGATDVFYTSAGKARAYGLAVRYAIDNYAVSLAYESNKILYNSITGIKVDQQNLMLGAEATFGPLALKAIVGHFSGTDVVIDETMTDPTDPFEVDLSGTEFAISADYTMDALTLTAFYTDDSEYDGTEAYGVGATYDLGGGATVKGGYVKDKFDGAYGYDMGVEFTF